MIIKRGYPVLLAILIVLNVLDYGFTMYGVKNYGTEVEANPLVRNAIEKGQAYLVLAVKILFSVLLVIVWHLSVINPKISDIHKKFINYLYSVLYAFDVVMLFSIDYVWAVKLFAY